MTNEELLAERERQIRNLINLGFNKILGKSELAYRASMPYFAPQPPGYKGRFDIPLIVDPRISIRTKLKLAGINASIEPEKIVSVTIIPKEPYSIWTHDASRYRRFSVKSAIGHFHADEMMSSAVEVIALYLQYPEIFMNHGVDASGSLYGRDNVVCVDTFFGRPELSHGTFEHPDSRWGTLSRGKQVNYAAGV